MDNVLVGKTLTGIKIARDREALLFQTLESDIAARVFADCCSYTWIEHVELPAGGFPALVTAFEDLEMPEGAPSRYHENPECLAFYGCKIGTTRGAIVIDYRNDSNGYYGGGLKWPGDSGYSPGYSPTVPWDKWQDII